MEGKKTDIPINFYIVYFEQGTFSFKTVFINPDISIWQINKVKNFCNFCKVV